MATSVLASALRHARASWRGQLALLACAVPVLGLSLLGISGGGHLLPRVLLVLLELLVLLAISTRIAVAPRASIDAARMAGELATVGRLVPRLLAQAGLAGAPALVAAVLAMQAAAVHPLLGLVLLPVVFAVVVLCAAPVMLATAAVVLGDPDYLPRVALGAARTAPWRFSAIMLAGGAAAAFATLPIVVTGLVVASLGGIVGAVVGTGIAAAAIVPCVGCATLALWEASGARLVHATGLDPDRDLFFAPALEHARSQDAANLADAVAAAPPPAAWIAGPSWDVAVAPGTAWGTWIRLEADAEIAFRVTWSGIEPPDLAIGFEDGRWIHPGAPAASGDAVSCALPAGNAYLQAATRGAVPQAVAIAMLVHARAAA